MRKANIRNPKRGRRNRKLLQYYSLPEQKLPKRQRRRESMTEIPLYIGKREPPTRISDIVEALSKSVEIYERWKRDGEIIFQDLIKQIKRQSSDIETLLSNYSSDEKIREKYQALIGKLRELKFYET